MEAFRAIWHAQPRFLRRAVLASWNSSLRVLRAVESAWGRSQLARAGVLNDLERFNERRPPEAFEPQYGDLWALYRTVRRHQPTSVLEFGSGCSTLVLARALERNGRGFLHSVDSDGYWADVTRTALPPDLPCEIYFREAERTTFRDTPVFRHRDIPDVEPQLVYLDGPPLEPPDRTAAIDLLEMELPPGAIVVVDERYENVALLRRYGSFRGSTSQVFRRSTLRSVPE